MSNPFSQNNLLHKFGDSMVRVTVSESGRFDGPEDGKLWGLTSEKRRINRIGSSGDVIRLSEKVLDFNRVSLYN